MFRSIAPVGLLAVLSLGISSVKAATPSNPTHDQVHAGLAVHGGEESRELASECQLRYEAGRKAVEEFVGRRNRNQKIDPQALGEARVAMLQLRRLAQQLQIRAEPAGLDYFLRSGPILNTLEGIVVALRDDPQSAKPLSDIRAVVQRGGKQREQSLEKVSRFIEQKKWLEAERELYATIDKWEALTVFLSDGERQAIYSPFEPFRTTIDPVMIQGRRDQARTELKRRLQESMPDLERLRNELQSAVNAVRSTGLATVGNESLTGPGCAQHFGGRWQLTHAAILRSRAVLWAMQAQVGSAGVSVDNDDPAGQDSRLVTDYAKFTSAFIDGLVALVEADATRGSGAAVADLHLAYLQAFAPLVSRVDQSKDHPLLQRLVPALAKLAARDPSFAAQVASYQQATDDLLRWRQRIARAQAAQRQQEFMLVDQRFLEGTVSTGNYVGLFPGAGQGGQAASLMAAVPAILPTAAERMLGKPITLLRPTGLATGKGSVIRLNRRTYANLSRSTYNVDAAVEALRNDLLITDATPPRTITAAVAFDSALRGDLAAVGGTISGFHLESLITRVTTIPDVAAVITPLGDSMQEPSAAGYLPQMVMRFDFRPRWVQHSHFFVELPAAEQSGGSE